MDFLMANAFALDAPLPPQASLVEPFLFIGMLVVFLFIFVIPHFRRSREQKKMLAALGKGDEIVTTGGLLGRIVDYGDNFILLEVNKGVQVKIQRAAIATLVPKGTVKTL